MNAVLPMTDWWTAADQHWFAEGTHVRLYRKLGAHGVTRKGVAGTHFAVWAPNAQQVSVMGDFNGWDPVAHTLERAPGSSVWQGFVSQARAGARYQYRFVRQPSGTFVDRPDSVGFARQPEPETLSQVWQPEFDWQDGAWLATRGERQHRASPLALYEVHLGSWRRVPEEGNRWLTYRELAPLLADHAFRLGFTHVALLPVQWHLAYESGGYDVGSLYAPSGRYGTPTDLQFLIDHLHQRGLGVVLDWVLAPRALAEAEPTFDVGWPEVRSLLLSSALYWLEHYHVDGLRVVEAHSTKAGTTGWGEVEAIAFRRQLTETIRREYPDVRTFIAKADEERQVADPAAAGGAGFDFTWDRAFARDTLDYLRHDTLFRKYHHHLLLQRDMRANTQESVLPLSHEEMGRGQGSLLARMPGDPWQQFANLRLLLAYLYLQPGKKLLFMGNEFGQWNEWNCGASLDWHLLAGAAHGGTQLLVGDLNRLYRTEPALRGAAGAEAALEWIECHDAEQSTLSWLRRGPHAEPVALAVFNFTPVPRTNYRLGTSRGGRWREILNTDAICYGGSGQGNLGGVEAAPFPQHGQPYVLTLTLPPLGALCLAPEA